MGGVVIMSEEYGTVRIPGYFCKAFHRWAASPEFPGHVSMRIENGEFVVDLKLLNKQVRLVGNKRSSTKPTSGSGRKSKRTARG